LASENLSCNIIFGAVQNSGLSCKISYLVEEKIEIQKWSRLLLHILYPTYRVTKVTGLTLNLNLTTLKKKQKNI